MPYLKFRRSLVAAFAFSLPAILATSVITFPASAHAQITSGDIVGVVKDASGAAVPNASVTIKNERTGVTSTTPSNASGQYHAPNLLPGLYDVRATASGFQPTTLTGITVTTAKAVTADVTLSIGASTSVEVSANNTAVLDTTTQNLTQTFENEALSTLPTTSIGEGVINTSLLAPGVGSSGGIGIGIGPSIAGQRPRNNNFTIEGIDNNDKSVTGPLVYVPNDAVGNFTLITTQFSPEFGHSSGGQFNTSIVSGTNHFHGKLYEYFQNRNLNAASGIAGGKIPNPRFDFNRYGGQVGGPILRDKLFFFANYERQTTGQSESYYICTPTAAGLSQLTSLAGTDNFSATNLAQYEQYIPASPAQVDAVNDNACGDQATGPQSTTVTGPSGGSTKIPLGNYLVSAPVFTNFYAITTGVDYTISNSDSLRLRYIYNNNATQDTAAYLPAFFAAIPSKYYLFALSEYHNFTPNLTNEIRIGFNRYYNIYPVGPQTYPGLDSFPNLTFFDEGGLNLGPDPNAPQSGIQNLYQVTDNISYTKGKQTITIGFDGRKYIAPQTFTQRVRGDYEYSSIDKFLHDLAPDEFGERSTGNQVYYGDQTALYGYANDTYRMTDKVTLNAGLRYEFTSVPVGERAQSLNSVASVPGLISFHAPQPAYTNFAPRIGVEYAPNEKTSVRAGYGIAYDVLFDNLGLLSFPPQYSSTNDVGNAGQPAVGSPSFLANGGLPGGGSGVAVLTAAQARSKTSAYLPNQVVPYSENYTLTIQRNVGKGLTAEIGYVGTRGIHLPTQIQLNVAPVVNTSNLLYTQVGSDLLQSAGPNATNLAALTSQSDILPQYAAAGFTSKITSYEPYSSSNYNGLVTNLQGRMKNGLQLDFSYTYSRAMDNATAEVFSTVLTPRRPQDSQNLNADYSRSALNHTHRLTLEADYNLKAFAGRGWIMQNLVGNWVISPIYTYESPEYITAFSGVNSNLNGDSGPAIDRPLINPTGIKGTATGVAPIVNPTLQSACNAATDSTFVYNGAANGNGGGLYNSCAADTIGYSAGQIVNNGPKNADGTTNTGYNTFQPVTNAYYVEAGPGTLPNAERNTLPLPPTNNVDVSVYKRFTAYEHYSIEFGAQAFNVLNHAQYIPGSVDNAGTYGYTSSYNLQTVSSSFFNRPDKEFTNNARTMQLSAKFIF